MYSIEADRFYIGQTQILSSRLKKHNNGQVKSTKPYRPLELIWYLEFNNRSDAMRREQKLKNLKSQKRIIQFILNYGTLNPDCSAEFRKKIRASS